MLTWKKFKNLLSQNENALKMLQYYMRWGENLKNTYDAVNTLEKPPRKIVIMGMGGSGIVGYIIKDIVYTKSLAIDIKIYNTPNIPSYEIKRSLNILISHSGNTLEVLKTAEKIKDLNKKPIVITSDGKLEDLARKHGWILHKVEAAPLPRLGLPQLLAPILKILSKRLKLGDIGKTAKRLDRYIEKHLPERRGGEAFKIARALYGTRPAIYFPDGMASIAIRFKAMLNENSKHEAYTAYIPEIFHNQIEIYTYTLDSQHVPYILMNDDIYPKILKEFLIEKRIYYMDWIQMKSRDILYSYLAGIALHDIASIYLAVMKNVDPYTTPSISLYKELVRKW